MALPLWVPYVIVFSPRLIWLCFFVLGNEVCNERCSASSSCAMQFVSATFGHFLPSEIVKGRYKSELSFHYLLDNFDHWCDRNIHPLRPGQDCKTVWDYLKGLSPAWQIIRLEWRQLQLHCHFAQKVVYWFKLQPIEIGMFSTSILMTDIGSVENCWTMHKDSTWPHIIAQ